MSNDFDGYTVKLRLDDDGDWLASFEEMPNVSAFSDSYDEALEELKDAWQGIKESYKKRKEPIPIAPSKRDYSGQFNVRVDKRLHKALTIEASAMGLSLNALVSEKLLKTTDFPIKHSDSPLA